MDEDDPKIETEAEGTTEVEATNKQRIYEQDDEEGADQEEQNSMDAPYDHGDVGEGEQYEGEDDQDMVGNYAEEEENPNKDDNQEAYIKSPEKVEEIDNPISSLPEPLKDSHLKYDNQMKQQVQEDERDQQEAFEIQEEHDGNEVYDRHQEEPNEFGLEQEGEQYQYDEEGKEIDYGEDDEETKRLYDDENEDEMHHQMDHGEYEEEEEEEEEDPMQSKIRAIIDLCQQNNGKYGDTDFPPNDASLYKNPAEPPDYAESTPVVEWMRPEEANKNIHESEFKMIKEGMKPGDVKQGTLGD
jgi:hypothetical protein